MAPRAPGRRWGGSAWHCQAQARLLRALYFFFGAAFFFVETFFLAAAFFFGAVFFLVALFFATVFFVVVDFFTADFFAGAFLALLAPFFGAMVAVGRWMAVARARCVGTGWRTEPAGAR